MWFTNILGIQFAGEASEWLISEIAAREKCRHLDGVLIRHGLRGSLIFDSRIFSKNGLPALNDLWGFTTCAFTKGWKILWCVERRKLYENSRWWNSGDDTIVGTLYTTGCTGWCVQVGEPRRVLDFMNAFIFGRLEVKVSRIIMRFYAAYSSWRAQKGETWFKFLRIHFHSKRDPIHVRMTENVLRDGEYWMQKVLIKFLFSLCSSENPPFSDFNFIIPPSLSVILFLPWLGNFQSVWRWHNTPYDRHLCDPVMTVVEFLKARTFQF